MPFVPDADLKLALLQKLVPLKEKVDRLFHAGEGAANIWGQSMPDIVNELREVGRLSSSNSKFHGALKRDVQKALTIVSAIYGKTYKGTVNFATMKPEKAAFFEENLYYGELQQLYKKIADIESKVVSVRLSSPPVFKISRPRSKLPEGDKKVLATLHDLRKAADVIMWCDDYDYAPVYYRECKKIKELVPAFKNKTMFASQAEAAEKLVDAMLDQLRRPVYEMTETYEDELYDNAKKMYMKIAYMEDMVLSVYSLSKSKSASK